MTEAELDEIESETTPYFMPDSAVHRLIAALRAAWKERDVSEREANTMDSIAARAFKARDEARAESLALRKAVEAGKLYRDAAIAIMERQKEIIDLARPHATKAGPLQSALAEYDMTREDFEAMRARKKNRAAVPQSRGAATGKKEGAK